MTSTAFSHKVIIKNGKSGVDKPGLIGAGISAPARSEPQKYDANVVELLTKKTSGGNTIGAP